MTDNNTISVPRVAADVSGISSENIGDPLASVVEISPNKRYIRFDVIVAQTINGIQSSYKAFDTKNGIEVEWHHINLNALEEDEQSRVVQVTIRKHLHSFQISVPLVVFWFHSRLFHLLFRFLFNPHSHSHAQYLYSPRTLLMSLILSFHVSTL